MPFLDACFNSNVRLFDYETIRATKVGPLYILTFYTARIVQIDAHDVLYDIGGWWSAISSIW
jgi:hypothetical protein